MDPSTVLTYEAFSQEIPRLLRHLQDYVYLQSHMLCGLLCPSQSSASPGSQAQDLRRLMLETIDQLTPPKNTAIDSREWRGHHILTARYIEGRSVEELTAELSISQRQFYREHSQAIEAIARSLWEHYRRLQATAAAPLSLAGPGQALQREASLLARQVEPIDLAALIDGVMEAMGNLAEERGVTLSSDIATTTPPILANRTLLRQALLQTLSHLVDHPATEQLALRVNADGTSARISITATAEEQAKASLLRGIDLDGTASLVRILGGQWLPTAESDQCVQVQFSLPTEQARVILVIEDNPSAVQLVRRYLAEDGFQVISASTGIEALRVIETNTPDVIVLDVMLPGQDGWELLQTFRRHPTMGDVPILIASVLAETRLAESLGASGYLKKPYTQSELLAALREVTLSR